MAEHTVSKFFPKKIVRNQEQTAIQVATNRVIVVQANAGAAKTTTLALRIGEALANHVPPNKILALTFTSAARDVMRSRLLELGVNYKIVNDIQLFTFEEFSSAILARIEGEKEGSGTKKIVQSRSVKPYVVEALHHVAQSYAHKLDFLQIETHNIAIAQFIEAQLKLKAMMVLDPYFDLDELESVYSQWGVTATAYLTAIEYERIRRGKKDNPVFRAEFDATYDVAQYLQTDPGMGQYLPDYQLVICDELHDLNEAAFCILRHVIAAERRCFFVGAGDEHQVIHATLGASREFLETRFKAAFPSLKVLPLSMTYRHGPHLAYAMREFTGKKIDSLVSINTEIDVPTYDDLPHSVAQRVVSCLQKWVTDGHSLDDCAILMRDKDQSIEIENALRMAKLAYKTPAMASYLQWDEVLFLRGIMAILLNDLTSIKSYEVRSGVLDALATFGDLRIPDRDLESAKYTVAKNPELIFDFANKYIHESTLSHVRVLADLLVDLKKSVQALTAAALLEQIVQRMDLYAAARRIFLRPYDASVVEKAISGLISFARETGMSLQQFSHGLNEAETFATRQREKNVVTLDTVSNVKGREFEYVVMPGLEVRRFPNPLFDLQDERHLFYVAATRTKSHLSLLVPADPAKQSPFIAAMRLNELKAEVKTALSRNVAQGNTPPPVVRQYLKVPFHEKDQAKALGARFDMARKAWYVEPGVDIKAFYAWL